MDDKTFPLSRRMIIGVTFRNEEEDIIALLPELSTIFPSAA
jgi:hypothetical protein